MKDTKGKIYLKDSGIGGSSILTIKRKIMIALISVLSVFLILTSIVLVKKLSGTSKRNAVVKLYDYLFNGGRRYVVHKGQRYAGNRRISGEGKAQFQYVFHFAPPFAFSAFLPANIFG